MTDHSSWSLLPARDADLGPVTLAPTTPEADPGPITVSP